MADGTQGEQQSSSQGASQAGAASTSTQENSSAGKSNQTQADQTKAAASTTAAAQTQQTQVVARPEYVPESYWDATAGKVKDDKAFAGFINEAVAFRAAEDVKRLSLPQTPEAYKVELAADFKAPEGIKFEFRQNDPLLAQARTMAHTMGISQENFSKLLGLYAGAQVATQQEINTARNAEIAKLGTTGPARVTAITTWMKSILGEAEGAQLASRMFTARDIEIAEKLVTRFASQGGGSFRQTGREADNGSKVDDATWDRMSYGEKKSYAERHTNGAAA